MILMRTEVRKIRGSFENLILKAKTGDNIILCRGNYWFYHPFRPHPQGVMWRKGDKLLLNGKKTLYQGEFDEYEFHPKGFCIRKGNQFLLNGKKILYEAKKDDLDLDENIYHCRRWDKNDNWFTVNWEIHPEGIIIKRNDMILFNGTTLLYQGEFNEYRFHPKGFCIRKENKRNVYESSFLLNGTKILYEGESGIHSYDWDVCAEGVIIRRKWSLFLNGEKLIYEGGYDDLDPGRDDGEDYPDAWHTHPKGIVLLKCGRFWLNGKQLLYNGEWLDWKVHPLGFLVKSSNKIVLCL